MVVQRNKSKLNFFIVFIVSILFFYVSYIALIVSNNIYLQIVILLICAYLFINAMYKFVPSYVYKIIDDEIYFIREFSERFYDDYKVKIKDIESLKKSENYSLKFWNHFYNMNRENEIYIMETKYLKIKFDPNDDFIEKIEERMKRFDK